jgi:hypothetical protein
MVPNHFVKTSAIVIAFCIAAGVSLAPRAIASTAFAITATNVTMPASGNGMSNFTVTGIPITGSLAMDCQYSGPSTTAKIPLCGGGPSVQVPVTEGQSYSGVVYFRPSNSTVPADSQKTARNRASAAMVSLAGAVLLCFGFGRRSSRRSLLLAAICAFAILPVISACGDNYNGMTPGTYSYTITAGNSAELNPLIVATSTTVNVTVP